MNKQKQIQQALNTLGWSHRTFAEIVYEELNEEEGCANISTDTEVIRKLASNIKKQLQRSSTSDELLERYMQTLAEHPDYVALNLGNILTKHVAHNNLSDHLTQQLTQISKAFDELNDTDKQ